MLEIKHATTREVLLRLDGDTWEGRNLSGAALDGANLINLPLAHSVLRQAQLRRADLSGALLRDACLDGANLERARLVHCDLTSATLLSSVLIGADLRKAILRYASLTGASCEGANLGGADMSMCDARANFRQANLAGCDLRGANLAGANLQQADLTGADLTGANLAGTLMVGAKMQGTKMPPVGERSAPPLPSLAGDAPAGARPAATRAPSPRPPAVRPKAGADWITRSGPDFDSLLVNCPECGFCTRMATSHLDGSYRCRACQAVFKLDASGKAQAPKKGKTVPASWQPKRPPSKIATRLGQAAIALAALGILASFGALGMTLWRSLSSPSSLSDRAIYVAEAFVAGDSDRLAAIARPGSGTFIDEWQKRRPQQWDALLAQSKPQCHVQKVDQGAVTALATVRVTIPAPPNTGRIPEIVTVNLCWTHGDGGQWVFDAAGTVKMAPRQY